MSRRLILIFALAVAINYPWEIAQTPLYLGMRFPEAIWHCFFASLGDGLLVLFIFWGVAGTVRSVDWYLHPHIASSVAMFAAGLAIGFAVEWWGLHIAERWQYSDLMPLVPGTNIGAVPILQMLVLPPVIFWAMARITLSRNSNRARPDQPERP